MFSGLRQGNIIYLLDKSNLSLTVAEVVKTSNPYTMLQKQQGNKMQMMPTYIQPQGQDQFVDIVAKSPEHELNLEELPSNQSYCFKNNVFVCDNIDAINAEIDSNERSSKMVLDSVPYHEKAIEAYKEMKLRVNPQFAKDREQEEKIGALEVKMDGIENTLNQMMGILSEAIGHNKPRKSKEE